MYKKRIIQGLIYFIAYWIILPAALISIGVYINPGHFPEVVKIIGKIVAAFGFVFGMISASYMIIDGGGGPMYLLPPKKLVTCGTFSICRHPVYFGFIIYLLGLSLTYGYLMSFAISAVFSVLIILWAVLIEERQLSKKYPEYEEYKKKVPAFWPQKPIKDDRCPPLLFMFLFYVGYIVSWFTWHIRFEKKCKVPEQGYMVVANHVTYLDFAVVVYTLSRFISFPVSLFHYKRKEWLYKNVGSFPINRFKPDVRAIMRIISYVKKGGRLGIFPEAERSWDGRFLGFKQGFDKLIEKVPKPIIGVRIEKAHLLFPRWGKHFYPGKVNVIVDCFEDQKELEEFLSKPSVDPDDRYASYKGVENYVYRCPKCGKVGVIKSNKNGFYCKNCGFSMEKPTVGQLWEIRDKNIESLTLPFSDKADIVDEMGKVVKRNVLVIMDESGIEYDGNKLEKEKLRSFIVEGRHEIFFYDGRDAVGFRFKNSSVLLWNDLVKKFYSL